MSALPFAVDRYGRLLAPIDAGNPGNDRPDNIGSVSVTIGKSDSEALDPGNSTDHDTPLGTASAVLPETGEKGVPPRHALLRPPDLASANMGQAHVQPAPRPGPATADMLTQGEIARAQGFTGDCCVGCGGFSMRRNGTCLLCVDCGSTTGCS